MYTRLRAQLQGWITLALGYHTATWAYRSIMHGCAPSPPYLSNIFTPISAAHQHCTRQNAGSYAPTLSFLIESLSKIYIFLHVGAAKLSLKLHLHFHLHLYTSKVEKYSSTAGSFQTSCRTIYRYSPVCRSCCGA